MLLGILWIRSLRSPKTGILPGTTSPLTSYSAGSEVALINLNVTSEGLHLLKGHLHQPLPHEGVYAMHCAVVQACQLGCREAGNIHCKDAD